MKSPIWKFERDMLQGEYLHIRRKRKSTSFKKHWHNYYEIICYENCEGTCDLNGQSYPIRKNCLFLLTPKDFHQITTQDKEDAKSCIISFSEQLVDPSLLDVLNRGPIVLDGVSSRMLAQMDWLYHVFQGTEPYRERQLHHLFNSLLIDILETGNPISAETADLHPYIRESICCMLTDPAFDFSLAYFAQRFSVTPTYFSHLFHEQSGIPFKQYLTDLRIGCARRMLEEQEMAIIDIGYECGFLSTSQFIRSFKKATGVPPSVYRKLRSCAK